MISKIELWANVLFQKAEWRDTNRDGRIEPDEVQPSERLTADEKKRAEAEIVNEDKPMIQKLDSNKDGLSFEEIKAGLFPKMPDLNAVDLDKAIDALRTTGSYDDKKASVLFCNSDMMPKDILSEFFDEQSLKSGAAVAKRVRDSEGKIKSSPHISKDVITIILVPGRTLQLASSGQTERLKIILKHELIHVQQGFNGKLDENFAVRNYLGNDRRIPGKAVDDITALTYNPLQEIEAHIGTLKEYIARGDIEEMKHACLKVNCEIGKLNVGRTIIDKYNAASILELLDGLAEESLPKAEMEELNRQMGSMTADKPEYRQKCRIYRDFDEKLLNQCYTADDLRKRKG